VILIAPFYALPLAAGALLADSALGFPRSVVPNIFTGSISIVTLVFMGLPLHSLWQRNVPTAPALTALYLGHLTFGLAICLILGLWAPVHWRFEQCVSIFPSLSFAFLATAWIASTDLRSNPSMAAASFAFLTLRSLAAAAFASILVGPSIIYILMEAIAAWRHVSA